MTIPAPPSPPTGPVGSPVIGLSSGRGPLESAFAFCAGSGVGGVELACQVPANRPHMFDEMRITGARELADRHGLSRVLHSDSSVNTAESTPVVRDAVRQHLQDYVRLADRLGCPTLVVHAGFHFDADTPDVPRALTDTLREVAELAGELGVTLALENMNVLPPEAEIRYLGTTAAEIAAILDAVSSPALGACLDVGHAHLLPGGVATFVERLSGRISHVQLTDNDGVHDEHLALGAGTLDVAAALDLVAATGYTGMIAIELDDRGAQLRSLAHLRALGLLPAPATGGPVR
ncbi:sugar phosphate isomerase/epimerase family protein [Pseudonocardia sp. NPDC049635]|uniref:sugar phosphate isomerase/epimerase family protein n=1 Tax=Pseudonocardia sp. NPDC049635 TaxID=3155506 RepID=UPI0033C0D9F2